MAKYTSLYEKLLEELNAEGKIIHFSPQENLEVLEELNKGMDEFNSALKAKERFSELELANVLFTK